MGESLDIEALYRRYGDLVQGRCRSLLRSEQDAAEATQEVFLRLWRYRDSFRGEASPTTWLFKITTSTCLNRLRTRRRHPEELVDTTPQIAGPRDAVASEVEARQLLNLLVEEEDERTRAALVYHHIDGMTHDETGEMLGISGAAVRKRIAVFREKVRGRLPGLEGS
ncbi:MAG: RNA polymerase sigma factor [Myxococcales bacterium]|nr:RNA polymerase sigma factor [Myxococcales bacterium]